MATIPATEVISKRFENPDEVRDFPKGRFELVNIGGMTIGRAKYEPGWRWSVDVGPGIGSKLCSVEHLGIVLEGRATVSFENGRIWELTPGTLFHVPPEPHDSWVLGDEPYVSLHFLGASHYAK
jgi:AraC-like ligand binding domain